ncbi:DUF6402 family protein [Paracidovorax valerianellae]|uniref:Uncharacterized protein n=1 Tax=Paracidovorax valerianellae TaxID=187868 RepID=A0A1G7C2Y5_9BURK|nr:DUF6402 family protein [Paracidovorax valerianellae]MDA8446599.1 DUF6402 family protein [Paracidovorax valerianellae]SDE33130.1 hypothetical protein SAMN05192589_11559 [Paracidovorax valerianellae]
MGKDLNAAALAANRLVAKPIALDSRYPAAACFKHIQLTDIPAVMNKNGFRMGAALMERWFIAPAFSMPISWKGSARAALDNRSLDGHHVDTTTVSMSWALRFGRTQDTFAELTRAVLGLSSIQSLNRSKEELFSMLRRAGKFGAHAATFGEGRSVIELHETAHVNARPVSSNGLEKLTDPIDDLYCALGAFTLHVAAEGVISPLKRSGVQATHQVDIHGLAFYIRDCYDFTDDQPLGNWDASEVQMLPARHLRLAENASFRQWRDRHQRGGDFIIFSDIHRQKFSAPLTWYFKES